MTKRIKLVALIVLFLSLFGPVSAAFADVPFVRWERGQVQQIVLGGVVVERIWKLELRGENTEPLVFEQSEVAPDNFIVFSVMIPQETPTGPYSVVGISPEGNEEIVAAVELSGAPIQNYKVTQVPRDLAFIIGILIFITAVASTMRAKKYSSLSFNSTQAIPTEGSFEEGEKESFLKRIRNFAYKTRVKSISGFETSFFKFILIQQGELVHRLSKFVYAYLPFIALLGGAAAALETSREGGIGKASILIFIAMAIVGIIDAYSGILATLGFWVCTFALGGLTSYRDILLMFAIGIAWMGPVIGLAIFQNTVPRDFVTRKKPEPTTFAWAIALVSGSVFGTAIFFLGQQLINTIIVTIEQERQMTVMDLSIVAIALLIRGIVDKYVVNKKRASESKPLETLTLARVSSAQTALLVAVLTFGYSFLWTENLQSSAIFMALFTTPYFLLLIRFNKFPFTIKSTVPRNILLESAVVTGVAYFIYQNISSLPLLSNERANLFLIFAGIPAIVHAIYSVITDSLNRIESTEE